MWGLWPPVPLVDEVHHVVHVDGIHLHRDAVVLIAVAGGHVIGWHCVCSIESGPCERVDVFHVSGRFWSTSACGEKRTPARPAWTSFPS